jgi:hypothetical protein
LAEITNTKRKERRMGNTGRPIRVHVALLGDALAVVEVEDSALELDVVVTQEICFARNPRQEIPIPARGLTRFLVGRDQSELVEPHLLDAVFRSSEAAFTVWH